jgi:hypothetical protein
MVYKKIPSFLMVHGKKAHKEWGDRGKPKLLVTFLLQVRESARYIKGRADKIPMIFLSRM